MNQPPVFGQRPTATPPRGPMAPAQPARPSIDFRAAIRKGPTEKPPRIVMIGVEGVGKSTAGAGMPNPIFLCAEDGLVGPQFAETPSYSASTWEEVMAFLEFLRTDPAHGYQSLVTDTLDWLEPLLFRYVCDRDNKASIEDYGYGKGYIVAAEEFRRFLAALDEVNKRGVAILILAHTQIKAFNNPIGENFDRYEPKVAKQIAGMVKEWADVVLFARFQVFAQKSKGALKAKGFGGQERIVHTTHCAGWDAKNRYGLPEEMPLDMVTILEAIKSGNGAGGESAENLINEITTLSATFPADKLAKVQEALTKAGTDAAALALVLNRVRTTITNLEANNG